MVVVGGGHNGLVAAAYLARAGLDVVVLEQAATAGGAVFGDDATAAGGARLECGAVEHTTILGTPVLTDLDLDGHGLRYHRRRVAGLHLFGDGRHMTIAETAARDGRVDQPRLDPHDAEARWSSPTWPRRWAGRWSSTGVVIPPCSGPDRAGPGAPGVGRRGPTWRALATCSALDLAERWSRSEHLRARGGGPAPGAPGCRRGPRGRAPRTG